MHFPTNKNMIQMLENGSLACDVMMAWPLAEQIVVCTISDSFSKVVLQNNNVLNESTKSWLYILFILL